MVLRDGETVLERYWEPYTGNDLALVYSASKTFTAAAVGLAIEEGHLSLSDRIVDLLDPGGQSRRADPGAAQITVHHLLSMSTGHTEDTQAVLEQHPAEDWADLLLALAPQARVGSVHTYNNGASWALGEAVRRRTGQDLLEYLQPRLLEPLGIAATWDRDRLGRCLGWTGLHVNTRALAAMGELYRCDGLRDGRRLLPEGWVATSTSAQIPTAEDSPEWDYGYGYQLWLGREGYRLDGAFGQFAFVLPARGLVIAVQSAQSCTQQLIDLLWEHLDAGTLLQEPGEQSLALPVPADSGAGGQWVSSGPVPHDPALAEPGEEQGEPADLTGLVARREGGRFRVRCTAEGHPLELVAEPGRWHRQQLQLGDTSVPVALAAGVDASGALLLRLVLTDTPHTLRIRLAADGTAGQAWRVKPLQGPRLRRMRAG